MIPVRTSWLLAATVLGACVSPAIPSDTTGSVDASAPASSGPPTVPGAFPIDAAGGTTPAFDASRAAARDAVLATADAAPAMDTGGPAARDSAATMTSDAARALDARTAADAVAGPPIPGVDCRFQSCGGNVVGNWQLKGYCPGGGMAMIPVDGGVVFTPTMYSFTLLTLLPMMPTLPPVQNGRWVPSPGQPNAITGTPTDPAQPPYWPYQGAFIIGRNWGRPVEYCVTGTVLKWNAANNNTKEFWVFVRI